jgi:hypothetical protein
MKTTLHTLLLIATALSTGAARAQENPPALPPRSDAPPLERESPRREGESRRPGQERPRGEDRQRPDGDRPPGDEPRRGPGPGDAGRREGEPRGEGGPRFNPPMPPPTAQRLRPYLGVVTSPAPAAVAAQAGLPEGFGLVVDEVLPDSPAKAAGIERYDVLTKFDDQKLVDPAQLAALVAAVKKDAEVPITLLRRGQEQKVTVKVGEKMLPDRPSSRGTLPDLRDIWRRYGEEGAPFRERIEDAGRRAQEMGREFQRRMQEFQEKVEQWRKNPSEKFPEPPKFPSLDPAPPPANRPGSPPSERMPRSEAPGAGHSERHTTIRNTAQANISIKDDDGEIEVRSDNGRRTLIAKDRSGATIFNGAIDTEEQRRALPENVRRKLDRVEVRTRIEHSESPREGGAPPPPRGGDVQ